MKIQFRKWLCSILVAAMVISISMVFFVSAAEEENKHYLGSAVNTGKDNGYSGSSEINSDDPHWGWEIGEFYVSGYTRHTVDSNGNPVFLKNVGDTVTLWFELQQDISKLNGDDMLSISGDTNGYDEYFGIEKTDFGKGTLIIRHTDYQNHVGEPVIYTNYLEANLSTDAAVEVQFFEEGDYEVALNYEVREDNLDIFGWNPLPTYHNYRIYFRFSVRNGNCMVYPFDAATGAELTNSSLTENGFYLDLAKSRYLDIDIKKTVRAEGAEGLVEDTRFNKPAKDGEKFTDEGIYTITVHNKYTEQTTTKVIYVGTDDMLKAHVVTGLPIGDIEYQLSMGATVAADGTIIPPPATQPSDAVGSTNPGQAPSESPANGNDSNGVVVWMFVLGGILLLGVILVVIAVNKKRRHCESNGGYSDTEEHLDGGDNE